MGDNAFLSISCDLARDICSDPELGKLLDAGVRKAYGGKRVPVCPGLRVVDHFHSNEYHLLVAGGNTAWTVRRDHNELADVVKGNKALVEEVKQLLDALGYDAVISPRAQKPTQVPEPQPKFL